ncbi:hypothetical protein EXU48_02920 [Occultella glacieicola]|uniref:Uncharacterized protein n=1 Tax=Occultella glacieicola TaxID=2518684 RepID=A0ABY2E6K9_9MICO|nr:hypothetical protein [Occultella glacieicola]TDE97183.1 hypothetical protein EXU48_02920 [Occultella glacieicola]
MQRVGPDEDGGRTAATGARPGPAWVDIVLRSQAIAILAAIATGLLAFFIGLPLARDVFHLGCGPAGPAGDYVCADGIGYGAGGVLCCGAVGVVVFVVVLRRGARSSRRRE